VNLSGRGDKDVQSVTEAVTSAKCEVRSE
jgi:tryptophan synthase beta subunit